MIVAIHQPNFFPWLGYFAKIARADRFIFLDSAQYSKNSFINRNRIKTEAGVRWLTVPVATAGRFGQSIAEAPFDWTADWRNRHLRQLQLHYARAPFFRQIFPRLESLYGAVTPETTLGEFNMNCIRDVCGYLDLHPHFELSSALKASGGSTELLVNLCTELGATTYLAGKGATSYQQDELFSQAGISVEYSAFQPPVYPQLWGAFEPGLSVLDALMNIGPESSRLCSISGC